MFIPLNNICIEIVLSVSSANGIILWRKERSKETYSRNQGSCDKGLRRKCSLLSFESSFLFAPLVMHLALLCLSEFFLFPSLR